MADLVKVRYIGPCTEGVDIAGQHCAHGDTIEVEGAVASGLTGQETWEVAGKKSAKDSTGSPAEQRA